MFSFSCKKNTENSKVKTEIEKQVKSIINFDSKKTVYYKYISEKDFSLPNISRKEVRIIVSEGLDKETLITTIKKATYEQFIKLNKPNAISILVYKNRDNTNGSYTVAKSDFAPNGVWESSKRKNYNDYKLNIDINDSYFLPKPKVVEKKKVFIVYNATKYVNRNGRRVEVKASTVDLFNDPKNLVAENKIGEIPNNSKVVIIDTYKQSLAQGYMWITYKVKFKNKTGWIFESQIK